MAAEASSSSTSRCSHHVFLSFGEDTRNTFTDHLYTALFGAGFRTYRYDDEIKRPENIMSKLEKAIGESRSSIIVFSKGYAYSQWCLDELVTIVERKRNFKHVIMPVFYNVDPSEVRKQTESVAIAFAGHEAQFEMEMDESKRKQGMEKVEGWRAALKEVADLGGTVLENQADRHESKFIHVIVQEIANKLGRKVLNVTSYPTGIESRVKDINLWIEGGLSQVGIMVICGMGGIGKTTIAKTVYNQNFDRFEGSSFLANIRETSKQPNGLVRLQRQLLLDIFKKKTEKIHNVDEGIMKIKVAICCKSILVVLDDVDELDQVNAIFGMRDWFRSGSKIIITTRHERLLKAHEVYEMYEVKELDDDEALRLFSWHAFRQDHPIEAYREKSKKIIHHCRGLPLGLEVLGSSLYGGSVDEWDTALATLGRFSDKKIQNVLQISYDSLDDDEKSIFLDITCFFVGRDKDFAIKILEYDSYPIVGIRNLIRRCLVSISEDDNKIIMHQMLIDMGREIIRQKSPMEPGKRSRVWRHKDAYNVLRGKTGTETIEGLVLDLHTLKVDIPESDDADLKTDAFTLMRQLRILQLYNVRLTGRYEEFPKKLRWLCWHGFPLEFLPYNFPLENMVVLDMRNSSLEQFWKGTKVLTLLKILDLSHSHSLVNSPDFLQLPNLEKLILKDCINLFWVHESVGELGRLVLLNLRGCKNLRDLPREIVQLKSLEKLILSNCSRLDKLPPDLCKMESLKVLRAKGINRLASTTGEVKPWHEHVWSWISKLRRSPESICFSLNSLPSSLVLLDIANCNLSSDSFPEDLSSLSSLETLYLSGNPICSFPGSLKVLTTLRTLVLNHCTGLQSLTELPMSLLGVSLIECNSLEMITNLPNLFQDLNLYLTNCDKLVEVQGLWKLEPVGNIDSKMINNLGLADLDSTRMREVELFNSLIGPLKKAPVLQGLYECGIYSIFLAGSEIPDWFDLKSRGGSSISFTVPSLPNLNILGLNVCVVYALTSDIEMAMRYGDCIIVNNKTRDQKWVYRPIIKGIPPDEGKDVIWLSDWKIANLLMEAGDEVNVSVNSLYFFQVKEFGIRTLYDEEKEEEEQGSQSNINDSISHHSVIDLSVYQMGEGQFFLCNIDLITRELTWGVLSRWDSRVTRGNPEVEEGEYSDGDCDTFFSN